MADVTMNYEIDRAKLSFKDGEEYAYSFIGTNTHLPPDEAIDFYQKRGKRKNYIKEAKYNIAVGQLMLKHF